MEHGTLSRTIEGWGVRIPKEDAYLFQTRDDESGKPHAFLLAVNADTSGGRANDVFAAALGGLRDEIRSHSKGHPCFGIIMTRSATSFFMYRPELDGGRASLVR